MKQLISILLFCIPFFCAAMQKREIPSLKMLAAAAYAKKYSIPENYYKLFPRQCDSFLSKAFFVGKVLPKMVGCVVQYKEPSNNHKSPCKIIDTKKINSSVLCAIPQIKNTFAFLFSWGHSEKK